MAHVTPHRRGLAGLLAALSMIGPFSIDTMFPGFPAIAADFGVGETALQQIVSVYLAAFAVMSLFHGPISDAKGRRPVIVIGMLLYALASVGAALSQSMAALLVWRALQGACAGAGMVVGRAVVRDLFDGPAAQKLMSQVMLIFGIAPAIAPIVGAQLLLLGDWRWIFWGLAVFSVVLAAGVAALLPESLPRAARSRLSARILWTTFRGILADRGFWPLALSGTFNFSALFLYIVSAPAVVLELLGLTPQGFPWLFVPLIGGIMSGSLLSSWMAGKHSAVATVRIGYAMMLVASSVSVLLALVLPRATLPWSVLPLILQGAGVGLAFPTLTLLLLDLFPAHRGAASSLQSFVSLVFNAILAGVIAVWLNGSMLALALGSLVLALAGFASWRSYQKGAGPSLADRECVGSEAVAHEADPPEPA